LVTIDPTLAHAVKIICDRLSERTATLFLGAGVNAGIQNDNDEKFPLGQRLGNLISAKFLKSSVERPLDEAAEMAIHLAGRQSVNAYIYDLFSTFKPGRAHLALVQLPWDVIYTTNYDLLVEQAAKVASVRPAGTIKPICSSAFDLNTLEESDIPYYKIHGTCDLANTEEGRLILTKEDYRFYELHRVPLFKRLARDLQNRCFVFVGYSLVDPNFRAVLEDCRQQLGIEQLPRSYVIKPTFEDIDKRFWLDKYNLELVASTSEDFMELVKTTWHTQHYNVVPLEERKKRTYLQVDSSASFPKFAECFYVVQAEDCTGVSDPKRFFRGGEATWADIRDGIAPPRDGFETLFEAIFPELADPRLPNGSYLITGPAGTGKTTLLRTLCFMLAKEYKLRVLCHIPGTPLDANAVASLVNPNNPERIIVVVPHAADHVRQLARFIEEAKKRGLPITLLAEERKNQWTMASQNMREPVPFGVIELGRISEREIDVILSALAKHGALDKLHGTDLEFQRLHFIKSADKELLVALREITTLNNFDEIIRDEFKNIPSAVARQAYLYVSAVGQIDLSIRQETLTRLLNLSFDALGKEVFGPTEGILLSGEVSGRSRHTIGYRITTRHPIIASVIFGFAAATDDQKFKILNDILSNLDPGFIEDRRLLDQIVRRRDLVGTLASPEQRRAVYERLASILPNNPFVAQHRSILERDLGAGEMAIKFAREADRLLPNHQVIRNTLGMALEFSARDIADVMRKATYLAEASRLFEENIQRDRHNAFGYIGLLNVIRQNIKLEHDLNRRALLEARALSLLQEAFEETDEDSMIAKELAIEEANLGDLGKAKAILNLGLKSNPRDERVRDLLVRYHIREQDWPGALKQAIEGLKQNPTSWRLHRHAARLHRHAGEPVSTVKASFETAIRHQRGDVGLMVEYGAYLFTNGEYSQAKAVFNEARSLQISQFDKTRVRHWWLDTDLKKRVFKGRVRTDDAALCVAIAVPENFEAVFWRTDRSFSDVRVGQEIRFVVGFNAFGPLLKAPY
jgi:tetratricopeptide (TPR) repeat protein